MFKKPTGFIRDQLDIRDYWEDELFAGDKGEMPSKFKIEGLRYEYQGIRPYCVSFAVTTATEYAYQKATGIHTALSQPHLFHHSEGTKKGSSIRVNLETERNNGAVSYASMPMPKDPLDTSWGWFDKEQKEALAIPFDDSKKIMGYVKVLPDTDKIKEAIYFHGPVIVPVRASGVDGYYMGRAKRKSWNDNHVILIVGWDDYEQSWIIFDSLSWVENNGGYGELHQEYGFSSVYAITELPKNAKEIVAKKRSEPYAHCLNHYGEKRRFRDEQFAAEEIMRQFSRFNNQSVYEAMGMFFTVLINMNVYGGYNISYTVLRAWMPGDLINMIYAYRRTGELIFDPNKKREEYTKGLLDWKKT